MLHLCERALAFVDCAAFRLALLLTDHLRMLLVALRVLREKNDKWNLLESSGVDWLKVDAVYYLFTW